MFWIKNKYQGSEDQLVKEFKTHYKYIGFKFHEQVGVSKIKRRSDLILHRENRVINVEFKLHDVNTVWKQAKDHSKWADYSYICMPFEGFNYHKSFIKKVINSKIGLIGYVNGNFVTIHKAGYLSYKGGKSREIRDYVLNKIQ